jgi:CRISPR/Cas system-associated protein Csx1
LIELNEITPSGPWPEYCEIVISRKNIGIPTVIRIVRKAITKAPFVVIVVVYFLSKIKI